MKRGVENQGQHPAKKLKLNSQHLNTAIDNALDGQFESLKQLNAEQIFSQNDSHHFNFLQYLLFKLSKIAKEKQRLPANVEENAIEIINHIFKQLTPNQQKAILRCKTRIGLGILQQLMMTSSEKIFFLFIRPGYIEALNDRLGHFTDDGFGILSSAIKSGSEKIFKEIIALLQQPGNERALRLNLENFTRDGFGVLQQAINSGSENIFKEILALLQQRSNEHALRLHLKNFTRDGFGVLQHAIGSGSENVFRQVLALLQQRGNERALRLNLENFTRDGFGVLQQAINSGSENIFKEILALLQQPGNEHALRENLGRFAHANFGALLSAINSGSESIFKQVLALLQQSGNEHVLCINLENFNDIGFGVLQTAIHSGSEYIFKEVLALLQQPDNERALRKNLEKFTLKGFGVLQQAINSDSEAILKQVLTLLQKPVNKNALRFNLENINDDGFGVLQAAIHSDSENIFKEISVLLQKTGNENALRINLENLTHDGFGVLQQSIISGSETVFKEVLALLQQPRNKEALRRNLYQFTSSGFGILQTAINSGSETIFNQVLALLQQPGNEDALQNNLEKSTNAGFGVLHQAITSGSEVIFKQVLTLLQQLGNERALQKNLENLTQNGFGVLLCAIASGSDLIFENVLSTLQRNGNEEALRSNLEIFTHDDFGVLQSAITSGSEAIFKQVLALLQQSGNERALQKNLENLTHNGFGVLLSAIASGSEEIFRQILDLLVQQENKHVITDNILYYNKYGYNAFWSAIEKLSDHRYNEFLSLSQKVLSHEQWQALLNSPKNLARFLLSAKNVHFTKIKLLLSALGRAFGDTEALKILETAFAGTPLPGKLKMQYKKWLTENPSNRLLSNQDLIYNLKNLPFKPDSIAHLHERTFGFSDLVECDAKGKSILWCMAANAAFGNADFLIHYWAKYHHQLTAEDLSRREGENADGNSVLWYILYAYKKQPHNENLAEIVRELWQNFPAIFDLNYTPRDSTSERSVASILKQTDLGKDILLELTRVEERSLLPEIPSTSSSMTGIADKYLFGATPVLPHRASSGPTANNSTATLSVCFLKQGIHASGHGARTRIEIDEEVPGFCATFYGSTVRHLSELKTKRMTFICSGRKNQALVPFPKDGMVIWVLTAAEYDEIKNIIPEKHSALVIRKLESEQSGTFNTLALATARRLAIFLFAQHVALEHFLMMDDNVEKLLLKSATPNLESHWDTIYDAIKDAQKSSVCVSVQTQSLHNKPPQTGQLGSKLFSFNMAKITQKLNTLEKLFLLLPPACDASLWGEDYYFQLMLNALFPSQGCRLLPKEDIVLVRSKRNRNAFLASAQSADKTAIATPFSKPSVLEQCLCPERQIVVKQINNIIDSNIARARAQRKKLEQIDLLAVHAGANHQQVTESLLKAPAIKPDFKSFIKSLHFTPGVLFEHQIQAIKSFADAQENLGQIIFATGTGKTLLQCELARIAYQLAYPGQTIIIVTPQLALVEQFYLDFIQFSQTQTADVALVIPKHAIIKVSSAQDSVHVKALLANRKIMQQKSILIFCEKSFKEFLPHWNKYHPYMCLLDEFHEYTDTTKDIINTQVQAFKLGFTATPPLNCFKKEFYRFSIAEALKSQRLTSVVIDKMTTDFCLKDIDYFIKSLPSLLQRPHPRVSQSSNAKLIDLTGIIYLPSIEDCDKAHALLLKNKIKSYVIHSLNKHSQQEIEQFKRSPSGVILACQMLRIGFDHRSLGYIIIAQGVSNDQVLEQIVGRVMRRNGDKLGNVITFRDIARRVKKITGLLAENEHSVFNPDYIKLPENQQTGFFTVKKKTLKKERVEKLLSQEALTKQPKAKSSL